MRTTIFPPTSTLTSINTRSFSFLEIVNGVKSTSGVVPTSTSGLL